MSKKSLTILMVVCVFGVSLFLMTGCAKKSVIKDAATTGGEQTTVQKQAAAEDQPKDTVAAADEKVTKPADAGVAEAAVKKTAPQAAAAQQMFENIYFDYDKYDLKSESRSILQKVADFMKGNAKYILRVEGHCDERGTAEYNLALGQRRADAAMSYLVKLGIDQDRVTTLSYGEELPADPSGTEDAWAKNRRDNFVPILTK